MRNGDATHFEGFGEKYYEARAEGAGNFGIEVEEGVMRRNGLFPKHRLDDGTNLCDAVRDLFRQEQLGQFWQPEFRDFQVEMGSPKPANELKRGVAMAYALMGFSQQALRRIGLQEHDPLLMAWGVPPREDEEPGMAGFSESLDLTYRVYSWLVKQRTHEQGASLSASGIHGNHTIPTRLLEERCPPEKTLGEFAQETYIHLARAMAAMMPAFIGMTASTPFGNLRGRTVLFPQASRRLHTLPSMRKALNYPDCYNSLSAYRDALNHGMAPERERMEQIYAGSLYAPIGLKRDNALTGTVGSFHSFLKQQGFNEEQIYEMLAQDRLNPKVQKTYRDWIRVNQEALFFGSQFGRMEFRMHEGGKSREQLYQESVLVHLLMLRLFDDPELLAHYMKVPADTINHNDKIAIENGLDGRIKHPLQEGETIPIRAFLGKLLKLVKPMENGFRINGDLDYIKEMARGGPNVSETLRTRIVDELGDDYATLDGYPVIPERVMLDILGEHNARIGREFEEIRRSLGIEGSLQQPLDPAVAKVAVEDDLVRIVRAATRLQVRNDALDPAIQERLGAYEIKPTRRRETREHSTLEWTPQDTETVAQNVMDSIRIGAISVGKQENRVAIQASVDHFTHILDQLGLPYEVHRDGPYPWVLIQGENRGSDGKNDLLLVGHLDIVQVDNDEQLKPKIETDEHGQQWIVGRGSADMIGSVMTAVQVLSKLQKAHGKPPVSLGIVWNEENGEGPVEGRPTGTHALINRLKQQQTETGRPLPKIVGALERTAYTENGLRPEARRGQPFILPEMAGSLDLEWRGAMKIEIQASTERAHPGTPAKATNLTATIAALQTKLMARLTQEAGFKATRGFVPEVIPVAVQAGDFGENTLAGNARLDLEIRPTPGTNLALAQQIIDEEVGTLAATGIEIKVSYPFIENGGSASREHPIITALIQSVAEATGVPSEQVKIGKKPPASSARITYSEIPGSEAFVWGLTAGENPHSPGERMLVDSIAVGARALTKLGEKMIAQRDNSTSTQKPQTFEAQVEAIPAA